MVDHGGLPEHEIKGMKADKLGETRPIWGPFDIVGSGGI